MEIRPERPEGLCSPLSFVTQRDDFAYVGIDRSRMDLSATTICGYIMGCYHVVLLLPLYSLKDELWEGG